MQLAEHGIVVVTIPSHMSHFLQPLDCGVNNSFKHALRNLTFQRYIRMDGGLSDYRHSLLYCVKAALSDAENSFESTEHSKYAEYGLGILRG